MNAYPRADPGQYRVAMMTIVNKIGEARRYAMMHDVITTRRWFDMTSSPPGPIELHNRRDLGKGNFELPLENPAARLTAPADAHHQT